MRKILAFVALALLLALPVSAQTTVATNFTSDTAGTVCALIKFIGFQAATPTTSPLGSVAVDAATGDIALTVNGVGDNLNVDTGSVCAGGTANSLDVSDAQCDTMGEIADLVNASTHWRMVLVSCLRSDSSNNTLQTLAPTNANLAEGVPLYLDSVVADWAGNALVPAGCLTDIQCWGIGPYGPIVRNPFGGTQTEVKFLEGLSTYDTSSTFNIYSVSVANAAANQTSTATRIYQAATGATGTNAVAIPLTGASIKGLPDQKVIVRIESTAATSAYTVHATGERKSSFGP